MCESISLGRDTVTTSKTFECADATWAALPLWIYCMRPEVVNFTVFLALYPNRGEIADNISPRR